MTDWLDTLKRLDAEANAINARTDPGSEEYERQLLRSAEAQTELDALLGSVRHELIAVVEAAEELKLWEPGRKGWAVAHRRLDDALAALQKAMEK